MKETLLSHNSKLQTWAGLRIEEGKLKSIPSPLGCGLQEELPLLLARLCSEVPWDDPAGRSVAASVVGDLVSAKEGLDLAGLFEGGRKEFNANAWLTSTNVVIPIITHD
eukprot:Hpha_TRINITY_DN14836_c2_g1::TRINITY_DN14836_c2_g1_i1::g.169992::m.169992